MLQRIKAFLNFIKNYARNHKIIASVAIIVLVASGYFTFKSFNTTTGPTKYVLAQAEKGTIISSLSSSGQVAALDSIDLKAKTSGSVVYVGAKAGDIVKAGQLLVKINDRDAQKAVQSAENDLANAQLSTTDVSGTANDALDTALGGGLDALTNIFKDLKTIKTNLDPIFQESSYGDKENDIDYYLRLVKFYADNPSDLNFWSGDIEQKYNNMQTNLDSVEKTAWLLNKNSQPSQILSGVSNTYTAVKSFLDLERQALSLAQKYQRILDSENLIPSISVATTTDHVTKLSDAVTSLSTDVNDLFTAKTDITAKQATVAKTGVNIQSENLNIQQYVNALANAKDTLYQHYIYAPFDGVVSAINVLVGDTASGTVGSIITKTMSTDISFGETDIAKIKIGQKATLTFDAINDLTITGKVYSIDVVGTSSQGVVSYNVKIIMDVQDDRIKPGMSTTATIITDTKTDALYVPNSAVKTQQGTKYVLKVTDTVADTDIGNTSGILLKNTPVKQTVEVGLSDDSSTEITSGLNEGDIVVLSTTTLSTTTSASSSASKNNNNFRGIPGL